MREKFYLAQGKEFPYEDFQSAQWAIGKFLPYLYEGWSDTAIAAEASCPEEFFVLRAFNFGLVEMREEVFLNMAFELLDKSIPDGMSAETDDLVYDKYPSNEAEKVVNARNAVRKMAAHFEVWAGEPDDNED